MPSRKPRVAPEEHLGTAAANPVDILNVLAIVLLSVLVAVFREPLGRDAAWLLAIFASLLVFTLLSPLLSTHGTASRVLHDFSPVLLVIVIFNAVGPIIEHKSPDRWDAVFAAVDVGVFGMLPGLWRGLLGRPAWFVDLTYIAYCAYYVAPVALGIVLYRRHADTEFRIFVFTVVLTFYASYVGYFLFPTVGPRPSAATEGTVIGGGALSHSIRLFLNFAERNRTDAFPSGHAAGALICLYFARRVSRTAFAIYLPIAVGIIFSTVYLHYHYVIDLVAGAGLAYACGRFGPRLEVALEPREVKRWLAVHAGWH